MEIFDYLKHKRSERLHFALLLTVKLLLVISLIVFVFSFAEQKLSDYRMFYEKRILPLLVIALIMHELFKIDSKKSKMNRCLSSFERTLKAQEIIPSHMTVPFCEFLCTSFARNKVNDWVEHYVDEAIRNFEEDKSLSLYSMIIFEKEIKNNWEKYKGRTVSTVGFAPSSSYTFTFIAYPLFDDITESINSSECIYNKYIDDKILHIHYHQLVFRSNEKLPLHQMHEMTNIQYFISDYKQSEFDPGTKVILNGTLDMDERGNLTLTNCEITKYTKDIRVRIKEEQLK